MNLREQFKKETKEELYYTFQEYSGASIEEHGFSEEYVEWLEKKLVNKTNDIHNVSESDIIHECNKCMFDKKLGFCPKCDTDCYSH